MIRPINLLRKTGFPIAIAVALAFGATQAVGQLATLDSCPWEPPDQLGECQSQAQCNTLCVETYGGEMGVCDGQNCCGCLLK
jgi:hypothetical protein